MCYYAVRSCSTESVISPLHRMYFPRTSSMQVRMCSVERTSTVHHSKVNFYCPIGVLFIKPDERVYQDLLSKIGCVVSYDGGDTGTALPRPFPCMQHACAIEPTLVQCYVGFLNACFPDWFASGSDSRLPFGFNAQRTLYWLTQERQPGYWRSIEPLKIIHYSSEPKPWNSTMGSCKMGE